MPFEKGKKYKTSYDYDNKTLYLDRNNPYQSETADFLTLCGHTKTRFVCLLVHDFLARYQIDIKNVDKTQLFKILRFAEMQMTLNTGAPAQNTGLADTDISALPEGKRRRKGSTNAKTKQADVEDVVISENDMADMDAALAMFG